MSRFMLYCCAVLSVSLFGCANEPAAAPENAIAVVPEPAPIQEDPKQDGIGNKVADLFDHAKSKTPSLKDAKKWLTDAGDATGQTADDTMTWVNDAFKSLRDNGLTSAGTAKEWVAEDWKSINAWEYKVVSIDLAEVAENPKLLEETLNENGKLRWDCFHVADTLGKTQFYMKRQKKSYLKNVPLKDMLKLIPLLDSDGGQ